MASIPGYSPTVLIQKKKPTNYLIEFYIFGLGKHLLYWVDLKNL